MILATTREEFEEALGEDLMEKEAKDLLEEKVEQYSQDEEVIEMYSEYSRAELETESVLEEAKEKAEARGLEKGRKEGIKQGIEQGEYNKQQEIARKMLEEIKTPYLG